MRTCAASDLALAREWVRVEVELALPEVRAREHGLHRRVACAARLDALHDTGLALASRAEDERGRARDAELLVLREDCLEQLSGGRRCGGVVLREEAHEVVDVLEGLICALAEVLRDICEMKQDSG